MPLGHQKYQSFLSKAQYSYKKKRTRVVKNVKRRFRMKVFRFQSPFSTWSRAIFAILTISLESALNFGEKSAKNLAPQVATRLRRAATLNVYERFSYFYFVFPSFPDINEVICSWSRVAKWQGSPLTATVDAPHRLQSSSGTEPLLYGSKIFIWRKTIDLTQSSWFDVK